MCTVETIAIDGPAASGKSTLGKKLAEVLGYLFFDTGIMYRAVTYAVLSRGVSVADEQGVVAVAEQVEIDVSSPSQADGRTVDVLLDGQDITWEIRLPEVDANVSAVSAYEGVRRALTAQQRRIGQRGRVVMVGRDIGTVVLPEADLKVYLDASEEERARRRYHELRARGEPARYEEILAGVRLRDKIDSTRAHAPLKTAEDAVVVDSDHLDVQQVLERVLRLVSKEC